jgi:hypothetical protein
MNIQVKGKKYTLDPNIKFGLFKKMMNEEGDPLVLQEIIQAILKPMPEEEDIDEWDFKDIQRIMKRFGEAQKEFMIDFKKKLST